MLPMATNKSSTGKTSNHTNPGFPSQMEFPKVNAIKEIMDRWNVADQSKNIATKFGKLISFRKQPVVNIMIR